MANAKAEQPRRASIASGPKICLKPIVSKPVDKWAYSLFVAPRVLAITSNGEFLFFTYQRLTFRLMIGNMGDDGSYTFTIEFSDAFFPIAITVLRPLKRKLRDPPGLTKKRCCFQSRTQYLALQFRSFGLPAGQPSGKSRKTVRGGLNAMLVSQRVLIHNVGNPRASSALAISPTDR